MFTYLRWTWATYGFSGWSATLSQYKSKKQQQHQTTTPQQRTTTTKNWSPSFSWYIWMELLLFQSQLSWISWCSSLKMSLLFCLCCFVLSWPYVLYWCLIICFLQAGSQDTLNSIALKFNITPNKLVELNKLFTHTIVPGQVIIFMLSVNFRKKFLLYSMT